MAGGVGSRFWPASREERPKQFLDITGSGKSLIRMTYERCLHLTNPERVLVVTNAMYKELVQEHIPEIPVKNILCEPSRNNTAPCIAYTALRIQSEDPDAVMAVLPSDHVILKEVTFVEAMNKAFDFASSNNALMTLGIEPTRPDTGYGYIEMDRSSNNQGVFAVNAFKEKPNLETAQTYLDQGGYVWNAGIFIWSIDSVMRAFQNNAPDILEVLQEDVSQFGGAEEQDYINRVYPNTRNVSVDYALMELSNNVYTIPVDIGWSDLGTWASLYSMQKRDEGDVVSNGDVRSIECTDVLVQLNEGKSAVIKGLKDYIVIDDDNVLLIWPKSDEQAIKPLRKQLESEGRTDLL